MRTLGLALFLFLPVATAAAAPAPRVLFTVQTPSTGGDVIVANADGSNRLSLTGGVGFASDPAWSPDGTKVAFSSIHTSSGTGPGELYVVNADGSDLHAVTSGAPTGHFRVNPTWSPDGSQLAYFEMNGSADSEDIWVVPAGGGTPRRLTWNGGQKRMLAWQPHGPLLVYEQFDSSWGLWTLDVPTDTVRRLADVAPLGGTDSLWSPDGTQLAYADATFHLAVLDADGTNVRVLTADTIGTAPQWSADGRTLAVAESRPLTNYPVTRYGPFTNQDVFTVDVATGNQHRLTGRFDLQQITPASYAPSWWPDGSRLFFHTTRAQGMWQMNADGTCEQPYPELEGVVEPQWQPGTTAGGRLDCVDLRVRAATQDPQLALNRPTTVQVTIENDGNQPATGVRLAASTLWPGEIQLFCNDGGVGAICPVGTIPPGQSRQYSGQARRPTAGNLIVTFTVNADQTNVVAADTQATTGSTVLPCTIVGTWGADVLNGTNRSDRICGLPGPDRISGGPGDDYLAGGSGDDTIIGGSGHDTIIGGGGRDVIYARDGRRDWIDCGTERDLAIVDRFDHTSHCDQVVRG